MIPAAMMMRCSPLVAGAYCAVISHPSQPPAVQAFVEAVESAYDLLEMTAEAELRWRLSCTDPLTGAEIAAFRLGISADVREQLHRAAVLQAEAAQAHDDAKEMALFHGEEWNEDAAMMFAAAQVQLANLMRALTAWCITEQLLPQLTTQRRLIAAAVRMHVTL